MSKFELDERERKRLFKMMSYERKHHRKGFKTVAGIDEAGRGPLAGPVVAAVCVLPKSILIPQIDDSKKLSPAVREKIYEYLIGNRHVHYGIGIIGSLEIDQINIYQATIQAMLLAVQQLSLIPDCLLVDGLALPHPTIPVEKIIKGDQLSQSIAAASIIAKVTRDRMMVEYHEQWPEYGFKEHKGYGTKKHRDALQSHGPCPIHRQSFKLNDVEEVEQFELCFGA
jgi:ribonuclease HII